MPRVTCPDRGNDDAVRAPMGRRMNQNGQSMRRAKLLSHSDDADVERRDVERGQADQLVRSLKRIDDRREPEIENLVESQHVDAHGKVSMKCGDLARGSQDPCHLM